MPKAPGTARPRLGRSGTGSITPVQYPTKRHRSRGRRSRLPSTAPCRRCGRHGLVGVLQARVVQIRHRAGVGAAWRQPSRSPRQSPPAVTVMARSFSGSAALHRSLAAPEPVELCRQRPGALLQVLQVAVAVERPAVDAARLAAPGAGLRGARTGVVGLRPAGASVGLAEPRSGRDADLPGPAGHQVSPPLACCQAPTTSASRRAQPSRSAMATVLPVGGTCRRRSGCGWRPEDATAVASSTHGSPARTSGRRRAAPLRVRADPPGLAG